MRGATSTHHYIRTTPTWRAIQQDALGRLHPDGLEQHRVAQRQLHQLTDLRQLLAYLKGEEGGNVGSSVGGNNEICLGRGGI